MAAPTASDLSAFLGPRQTVDTAQANAVLSVVTSMASAYTRGLGFTDGVPNSDIESVIVCAAARLLAHSRQVSVGETYGPNSANYAAAPFAWSVSELLVLQRYRVVAI
ncbi:hypothetical protein [Mycobacterium angelicum]|uniref:Phage gp6-like head-tail connector protein n=1 Tax=Mycobacterium angelicum TaxID=470074 RepID=A0A1X0A1C7_MYCAN|nr:hypothetical protein [Mycobacterium angelicum]MCV7195406.1 hypothetical protein [Mycobacterium angelicum]ORA23830.1 hypothetical protein BST12_06645 [Mycobacterium angelicum]